MPLEERLRRSSSTSPKPRVRPALRRSERTAPTDRLRNSRLVPAGRSEEHTSELQSLMRISYAVFCLKKNTYQQTQYHIRHYKKPQTTHRHVPRNKPRQCRNTNKH